MNKSSKSVKTYSCQSIKLKGGYIMDKIKNVAQRLGIITVEDMERYTALELIMMIANKMNEFKEILNDQND